LDEEDSEKQKQLFEKYKQSLERKKQLFEKHKQSLEKQKQEQGAAAAAMVELMCPTCDDTFASGREFYEHLDDCVSHSATRPPQTFTL
jgi:hypothetical protein